MATPMSYLPIEIILRGIKNGRFRLGTRSWTSYASQQAASEDQSHDNDKRPEQESEFVDQLDV